MLSESDPVRVEGDLRDVCIDARADVLVTKKLTSFTLVSAVAPHKVDPDRVRGVAAAVGSGPNSMLAAAIAFRITKRLGVPGRLVTAPAPGATEASARELLDDLAKDAPGLGRSVQPHGSAAAIVDELDPDTLLVVGEPGGSWLHRQFFGPGRKLIHAAPTGALVVRAAPLRCFHFVDEPAYVGARMRAGDAVKVIRARVIPVVEDRELVGIARRSHLLTADVDLPVADLMEPPVALEQDDLLDAAWALAAFFESAPIPVVDPDGDLVGTIDPRSTGIGKAEQP
jgi:CBS domain-containing protein